MQNGRRLKKSVFSVCSYTHVQEVKGLKFLLRRPAVALHSQSRGHELESQPRSRHFLVCARVWVRVRVCAAAQSRHCGSERLYLRMTDSSFCISQQAGEQCDSSTHTHTPTHSALRQGGVQFQGCVQLHTLLNATPNFGTR